MKAIGVFGGTFDPVHYGHLSAAWQVASQLDIPVHMIVARQPPHRGQPQASAAQRWRMLQLALAGYPALVADRRELERDGPSYMIDTLRSFRADHPDRGICLVVGQDALNGFHTWHRWEDIPRLAHLVVLARPGYTPPAEGPVADLVQGRLAAAADLADPAGGRVYFLPIPALEISATKIRQALAQDRPPNFLMPPLCLAYARRERLYQAPCTSQPPATALQ